MRPFMYWSPISSKRHQSRYICLSLPMSVPTITRPLYFSKKAFIVRVVLDLAQGTRCAVSELSDPFRIIVDIRK